MPFTFFDAATLPAADSIVFAHFPYDEAIDEPGDRDHPCYIYDAIIDDDGNPWIRVICGTSQPPYWRDTYFEMPVSEGAVAGLSKDTRFNFRKIARLPWAREFFPNDGPPRALHVSQSTARRMGFEASEFAKSLQSWNPFGK